MRKKLVYSILILLFAFLLIPHTCEAAAKNVKVTATVSGKSKTIKGHFVQKTAGKKFKKSNGKYIKSTWITYGKNTYYFNKKGYASTGWVKISGYWYRFSNKNVLKNKVTTSQYVLVKSSGSSAVVYMLQHMGGGKYKQLRKAAGYVGRQGVSSVKRESDSKTPKGTFTLGRIFGVSSNPGTSLPYTKVNTSHYWVDDPYSSYYNQFVSTQTVSMSWNSAEHLIDYPAAYAYAVAINYNTKCTPGNGSAIFLHCSTGNPTAGCVSVPQSMMIYILKHLHADAKIAIL